MMNKTVRAHLPRSMSYQDYKDLVKDVLKKGKTTGPIQSEEMTHYTKMNEARMRRLDRTSKLFDHVSEFMSQISRDQQWLILTEAWCGDAAQIIPVIERMAEASMHIQTSYLLRDENSELMNFFLTNGGKGIPIIIVFDPINEKVLTHWGPRPKDAQQMVMDWKGEDDPEPYSSFVVKLQKWYNEDKGSNIQNEFMETLRSIL